ncbi:MAG: hypothetical protein KAT34_14565 [Candidatus Aminicenantes bacterium]|nr:hypothetical protein [Candidatus Aminicenantes bacterium]
MPRSKKVKLRPKMERRQKTIFLSVHCISSALMLGQLTVYLTTTGVIFKALRSTNSLRSSGRFGLTILGLIIFLTLCPLKAKAQHQSHLYLPQQSHREIWHDSEEKVIKDFQWTFSPRIFRQGPFAVIELKGEITKHTDVFSSVSGETEFKNVRKTVNKIEVSFPDGTTMMQEGRYYDWEKIRIPTKKRIYFLRTHHTLGSRHWNITWPGEMFKEIPTAAYTATTPEIEGVWHKEDDLDLILDLTQEGALLEGEFTRISSGGSWKVEGAIYDTGKVKMIRYIPQEELSNSSKEDRLRVLSTNGIKGSDGIWYYRGEVDLNHETDANTLEGSYSLIKLNNDHSVSIRSKRINLVLSVVRTIVKKAKGERDLLSTVEQIYQSFGNTFVYQEEEEMAKVGTLDELYEAREMNCYEFVRYIAYIAGDQKLNANFDDLDVDDEFWEKNINASTEELIAKGFKPTYRIVMSISEHDLIKNPKVWNRKTLIPAGYLSIGIGWAKNNAAGFYHIGISDGKGNIYSMVSTYDGISKMNAQDLFDKQTYSKVMYGPYDWGNHL